MKSSSSANIKHHRKPSIQLIIFFFAISPTPHLSWVKLTGSLPRDEPETENFGKILKIEQATAADEGTYQCTASNPMGRAKHEFHVHVEGAEYALLSLLILNREVVKGSK